MTAYKRPFITQADIIALARSFTARRPGVWHVYTGLHVHDVLFVELDMPVQRRLGHPVHKGVIARAGVILAQHKESDHE